MLSLWDRLFGRTRTERAENMAGNTWQLSPRLKRRDLPREKEGQNYNSVFDDNRHRFLEDLSQIQETERNFVV